MQLFAFAWDAMHAQQPVSAGALRSTQVAWYVSAQPCQALPAAAFQAYIEGTAAWELKIVQGFWG